MDARIGIILNVARDDDFRPATKRELERRMGSTCSICRDSTSGPRASGQGVVNIGVAAHITAASRDGPRYDEALTGEQRRATTNGIWLCQSCAKRIDSDEYRFTIEELREYKALAETAAQDKVAPPHHHGRERNRYLVCAFDVDGTLLRGPGFRYSWHSIWRYLDYDDGIRRRLFQSYLQGELSYEEWCSQCLYYFRMARLSRRDLVEIGLSLRPVENLEIGIEILKHEGFRVGIISGGVDSVLEAVIPKYCDIFDFVHINHFGFDDAGYLAHIRPTPFDFEGKVVALRRECERLGSTLRSGVFVGEGENDRHVCEALRLQDGLAIACPPNCRDVELAADVTIWDDDLQAVAKAIVSRLR